MTMLQVEAIGTSGQDRIDLEPEEFYLDPRFQLEPSYRLYRLANSATFA
jgi:hypothetical protein